MKTIIITLAILCSCISCVKIREDMRQERIQRPIVEIDSITPPDWEFPVEDPDNIGK